jgi:hypothetical protein
MMVSSKREMLDQLYSDVTFFEEVFIHGPKQLRK